MPFKILAKEAAWDVFAAVDLGTIDGTGEGGEEEEAESDEEVELDEMVEDALACLYECLP